MYDHELGSFLLIKFLYFCQYHLIFKGTFRRSQSPSTFFCQKWWWTELKMGFFHGWQKILIYLEKSLLLQEHAPSSLVFCSSRSGTIHSHSTLVWEVLDMTHFYFWVTIFPSKFKLPVAFSASNAEIMIKSPTVELYVSSSLFVF